MKIVNTILISSIMASSLLANATIDENYIKNSYPEVYNKIKEEGKKELSDELKKQDIEKAYKSEQWWLATSFIYPNQEEYRFHAEGGIAYATLRGNDDGYALKINSLLVGRKDRFTLAFTGSTDIRDTVSTDGMVIDRNVISTNTFLQYDLATNYYGEIGNIWEQDNLMMIDNRYINYGGLGFVYPSETGEHIVKIFGAVGYQTEEYLPLVKDGLGFDERSLYTSYVNLTHLWNINEQFILTTDIKAFYELEKSMEYEKIVADTLYLEKGEENRYRYDLTLSLEYMVSQNVSLVPTYIYSYDSAPWPGSVNSDRVFFTNLKFKY